MSSSCRSCPCLRPCPGSSCPCNCTGRSCTCPCPGRFCHCPCTGTSCPCRRLCPGSSCPCPCPCPGRFSPCPRPAGLVLVFVPVLAGLVLEGLVFDFVLVGLVVVIVPGDCVCQGCLPCHELCETCSADGISYCTSCKYYRQDDKCVLKCEKDYYVNAADPSACHCCHPNCVQCHGPSPANCFKCKYYTIYADLGIGGENGDDNTSLTVSGNFFLTVSGCNSSAHRVQWFSGPVL